VSRPRRWLVGGLAGFLIFGHAYDVIAKGEHWPLSSYPMYADVLTTPTFRLVRLFAVTSEEPPREVAIESGWMRTNLNRILRRPDAMEQLRKAITAYARTQEWSRDGEPVLAYRVYDQHWDLDPNADSDRAADSTTLIFELRHPTMDVSAATTRGTTGATTQETP
jgi:hypothetical protein